MFGTVLVLHSHIQVTSRGVCGTVRPTRRGSIPDTPLSKVQRRETCVLCAAFGMTNWRSARKGRGTEWSLWRDCVHKAGAQGPQMHGQKRAATRKACMLFWRHQAAHNSTCLCYVNLLLPCVPLYPVLCNTAGRHSHPHALDAREKPPV